jgi:MoaA/NifB/PqqE/SkfB family radical SAM enzyme
MPFRPKEILFSPTTACNLTCPHCGVPRSGTIINIKDAVRFLDGAPASGVERVGFTGGEPFLAMGPLVALTKEAVGRGLLFDRIMTNGVWWRRAGTLRRRLSALRDAGYDGSICVSLDAFHAQDPRKVARFIRCAASVWRRPDIVSIARVSGARDRESARLLRRVARELGGSVRVSPAGASYIRSDRLFVKVYDIALSPAGKASCLKDGWGDGRWFREDRCRGPGNVFMVMPDGAVKPCCGYASDEAALTIGNIKRDSPARILRKFSGNRFASTVFNSGLGELRRRLERSGVRFPGRTSSHCFFCRYVLTRLNKGVVTRCLDAR